MAVSSWHALCISCILTSWMWTWSQLSLIIISLHNNGIDPLPLATWPCLYRSFHMSTSNKGPRQWAPVVCHLSQLRLFNKLSHDFQAHKHQHPLFVMEGRHLGTTHKLFTGPHPGLLQADLVTHSAHAKWYRHSKGPWFGHSNRFTWHIVAILTSQEVSISVKNNEDPW